MTDMILHLDIECASSRDLKKVGLENFIAAPDFTVTAVAWAFDNQEVRGIALPAGLPKAILAHIEAGGEIRAHNASFEYAVLKDHYKVDVSLEQTVCTMQKALAYGLPASLLKAGKAINAAVIKDESKRLLMLKMSRPRAIGAFWHDDPKEGPAMLAELLGYCKDDVRAERCLDGLCPDLHPFEKALSVLDAKINHKGVRIDTMGAGVLRQAAVQAVVAVNSEATALTGGVVTSPGTQSARVLSWLSATQNVVLPDVAKLTVAKALAGFLPNDARRLLELRRDAAKASVAKLTSMLDVASPADQRARNLLQFYGAGRTGRWAGRLIQPQNLPRVPKGHKAQDVIDIARLGGLGLFWASPMDAISKSLRSMFVARLGMRLISVDLSQIEARVLAWLAGQADVLGAFARGEDVYVLAAKQVGSNDRQLGKVLVLACGFGMGAGKFWSTANETYGVPLGQADAMIHHAAWRRANPQIVNYWRTVEDAVRLSVAVPGNIVHMSHGMAVLTDPAKGVTQIRKPNTVKLTYHGMRVEGGELVFDGVNSKTKNWGMEKAYGGRLVENIVQSVSRDVMAEGMLRGERELDQVPVMSVHDEVVWEAVMMDGGLFQQVMNAVPAWARGLPVASELAVGVRYSK